MSAFLWTHSCATTRPKADHPRIGAFDAVAGGSWPWQSARFDGRLISNRAAFHGQQALGHACAIDSLPPPLAFLVLLFAGWVNRQQQAVIEYLLEENRVLRAAHGPRRLPLTDDQRRLLAVKGKAVGRRRLAGIVAIVTPDTIL